MDTVAQGYDGCELIGHSWEREEFEEVGNCSEATVNRFCIGSITSTYRSTYKVRNSEGHERRRLVRRNVLRQTLRQPG